VGAQLQPGHSLQTWKWRRARLYSMAFFVRRSYSDCKRVQTRKVANQSIVSSTNNHSIIIHVE
jgi:hypothetical protein